MDPLEDRVTQLERALRWHRILLLPILVFGVATVHALKNVVFGKADAVESSQFIVTDSQGNQRAALMMYGDQPGLRFYAKDGGLRAAVELVENGEPRIGIVRKGKFRAEMSFDNIMDGPMFQLADHKGYYVARLRLDTNGDPRLHMVSTSTRKILNLEPSPMR